jgi:pSer/pThr/pTyr-binding forkhead associated (FHA) protein
MGTTRLTLTITQGSHKGKSYTFEGSGRCIIGRAEDCEIRLPMDFAHADASRHHCLLEIDAPQIRVRDLGSRNGTFVNGSLIGKRPRDQSPDESAFGSFMPQELEDGDEVQVGHTVFQLQVEVPEHVSESLYYPIGVG